MKCYNGNNYMCLCITSFFFILHKRLFQYTAVFFFELIIRFLDLVAGCIGLFCIVYTTHTEMKTIHFYFVINKNPLTFCMPLKQTFTC